MRRIKMISRRNFIRKGCTALVLLLSEQLFRPVKTWADKDYFSGTDFVGKTREGPFSRFYINYWKPMRRVKIESWKLKVDGLCDNSRSFSLKEIQALPSRSRNSRMKCVECWSARATWEGTSFQELEKIVQPRPEAAGIRFSCADGYTEYLSRESLAHPATLLVWNMNGEPLSDEHGFPLRVIVPFKYGYKNPKAIMRMEYVSDTTPGTWSKLGPYSTDGTILPGYDHPLDLGKQTRRIFGGEIQEY